MKAFRYLLFALLCLVSIPAYGQTTDTVSSPQNINHWSVTGSAAGFSGGANGAQATTVTGASYQLTTRVSIGYQNINVPGLTSYNFGVAQYAMPLSSLVGKTLTEKLTFDASNVTVSFMGGAGEVMTPAKHIAETAGVYLSFPVAQSQNGGFTFGPVVGIQYIHSPSVNAFITTPSSAAVSAGLGITF